MPELIDKEATLKKMCETCGYCEKFEKAMRSTHPDFVTDKCNNYKFLAEQPTIEAESFDKEEIDLLLTAIDFYGFQDWIGKFCSDDSIRVMNKFIDKLRETDKMQLLIKNEE